MANQDPQPEIYTTRYNFNADTAGGATIAANTSQVVSIYTNQANNEEVRIYGIAVRITDAAGANLTGDYAVSIQVGANNVPSNQFDISWLANNIANGGGILMFPSPVLVSIPTTSFHRHHCSQITGAAGDANNQPLLLI